MKTIMDDIERKESDLYWREKYLQVMVILLRAYKWHPEKSKIMDSIKYFGKEAEKLKR